jgi:biopolymer transport protein ExbD
MPTRKRPRARIGIDMTPMVDIGFLLVIFFMSTYHARPPETVQVTLPLSRSPFKVPEADVMIVTVIPPDNAIALADSVNPTALLTTIAQYQLPAEQGGLGLKRNLAIERAVHEFRQVDKIRQTVLESASLTPEQFRARADSLMFWWNLGREASQPTSFANLANTIIQERMRNPRLRLIIKADKDVESGLILRIMSMLQDPAVSMLRFSMMTMLEETGKSIFEKKGG